MSVSSENSRVELVVTGEGFAPLVDLFGHEDEVIEGYELRYVDGGPGLKVTASQVKLRVFELLGQGGENRVYFAVDDEDCERIVALRLPFERNMPVWEQLADEVSLMLKIRAIDPEVIINVQGVIVGINFAVRAVILDLLEDQSLADFMFPVRHADLGEKIRVGGEIVEAEGMEIVRDMEAPAYKPASLFTWALDLLNYLEVAEKAKVVHRDLKPENVFIVDGRAKVADFGLAIDAGQNMETIAGSLPFISPEIWRGGHRADISADIYSVGVILYELFGKRHLYQVDDDLDMKDQLLMWRDLHLAGNYESINSELRLIFSKNIANRLAFAISKMLSVNYVDRPSILDLQQLFLEAALEHDQGLAELEPFKSLLEKFPEDEDQA
jgi:serine/threonine protein kinase